jgi:hypothetical protein
MLNPVVQGVHRISHSREPPTPGIHWFIIDSENIEARARLTLRNGFVNVQIQYSTVSFVDSSLKCSAPEKVSFGNGIQLQNRLR